jgi:hypothetical protein
MAASTAARDSAVSRLIGKIPYKVKGSTKVYRNCHVCVNAGYLQLAADTAGQTYVGLCVQDVDNSAGADGDLSALVQPPALEPYHEFDCSSAAQATWLDVLVYFVDDHTVALAATTTNDIPAGRVTQVLSSTKVVVDTTRRS